jgi:hypothetical protein
MLCDKSRLSGDFAAQPGVARGRSHRTTEIVEEGAQRPTDLVE